MATHKIGKDRHVRLDLTGTSDHWIVNGDITVGSGLAIYELPQASRLDIDINGAVTTGGAKSYAVYSKGANSDWTIGAHALVKGGGGLFFEGRGSDLSNEGIIRARSQNVGVWFDNYSHTVSNDGSILAAKGTALGFNSGFGDITNNGLMKGKVGLYGSNAGFDLNNTATGEINASQTAIWARGGGNHSIVNDGSIIGADWALLTGRGADRIANNGAIEGFVGLGGGNDRFIQMGGTFAGYIYLGAGNDRFVYSGGTVKDPDGIPTQVFGGKGNDVYVTGALSVYLVETANGGTDTIKTSVSTTLAANIENLVMTGTDGLTVFGNSLKNHLTGNSGDNFFFGNGGRDIIDGKAGDDSMNGGDGRDIFIFSTGYDNDSISLWEDGTDRVNVSGLQGITDFVDMKNNYMAQVGADVVLTVGADTLTFLGVNLADMSSDDFIF